MIADIFHIFFISLAGTPFFVLAVLHYFLNDIKGLNKKELKFLFIVSIAFFIWQFIQSFALYQTTIWIYLLRAIDPFFILFLVFIISYIDDYEDKKDMEFKVRKFITKSFIACVIHAVLQIIALAFSPTFSYISIVLAFVLISYMGVNFSKVSSRILMRYRFCSYSWFVGVVISFPLFRIVFLLHLSWIYFRKFRRVYIQKERKVYDLKTEKVTVENLMAELSGSIRDVSDLKQSLDAFLAKLLGAIEAKSAAVYLWNEKQNVYFAEIVRGYFFPVAESNDSVFTRISALHESIYSQFIGDKENIIYKSGQEQLPMYFPYAGIAKEIGGAGIGIGTIQSLIITPILLDETCLGVLVVENKDYERYFTESDFSVVKNFSYHAAMMINSANLLKEKSERQRVDHELAVGYRIQSDLLPQTIPDYPGISLTGSMMPAKEIGGDYYDFIDYAEGELGIVIGDVSGKGVPAGMVMTIVHSLLHSLYPYFDSPKDLLVAVNSALCDKVKASMFITLIFFVYNSVNKTLKYVGCGHEHILIYRKAEDRLEATRAGGLALGMTDDVSMILKEKELRINPGDTIVLYTDGIVEARAQNGDMYSFDKLKKFVEKNHDLEPENLRISLVEDVQKFTKGEEQSDDITCLVMRFD